MSGKRSFTLSYHYFAQRDARNHLELFLDVADNRPLETWRAFRGSDKPRGDGRRRFTAAPEHRRVYLDFAGPIAGNRGRLRIVKRGLFVRKSKGLSAGRAAHDVRGVETRGAGTNPVNSILVRL